MIPVKLQQILLSNMGFVVLLKGDGDPRTLPIFIGAAEAQSIAIVVNNISPPRPLTHDLVKNILDFLEVRMSRVEITELKDGTFFARLVFDRGGEPMVMDSRPSDAIALALRFAVPIHVARRVMDEAGQEISMDAAAAGGGQPAKIGKTGRRRAKPKPIDDESSGDPRSLLERDLERAVAEERYEDAARIRDEIKKLDNQEN